MLLKQMIEIEKMKIENINNQLKTCNIVLTVLFVILGLTLFVLFYINRN